MQPKSGRYKASVNYFDTFAPFSPYQPTSLERHQIDIKGAYLILSGEHRTRVHFMHEPPVIMLLAKTLS